MFTHILDNVPVCFHVCIYERTPYTDTYKHTHTHTHTHTQIMQNAKAASGGGMATAWACANRMPRTTTFATGFVANSVKTTYREAACSRTIRGYTCTRNTACTIRRAAASRHCTRGSDSDAAEFRCRFSKRKQEIVVGAIKPKRRPKSKPIKAAGGRECLLHVLHTCTGILCMLPSAWQSAQFFEIRQWGENFDVNACFLACMRGVMCMQRM